MIPVPEANTDKRRSQGKAVSSESIDFHRGERRERGEKNFRIGEKA
jgi:hypothetical protein